MFALFLFKVVKRKHTRRASNPTELPGRGSESETGRVEDLSMPKLVFLAAASSAALSRLIRRVEQQQQQQVAAYLPQT